MDPGNLSIIFLVVVMAMAVAVLYTRYQAVSNQLLDAEMRVKNITKEQVSMKTELNIKNAELTFAEKKARKAEMRLENIAREITDVN